MKVLLSIKPEFVKKIFFDKVKKFEYRKAIFKKDVDTIVVYSTMPVGRIVGEFTIKNILSGTPAELWKKTKESSGVALDFYNSYFMGRHIAYAIEIGELHRYENEINPFAEYRDFKAPQSFKYWVEG